MANELGELVYALPSLPLSKILLVNVGSDDRPANEDDILDIAAQIAKARELLKENDSATIVTHHLVKMTVIDL